MTKRVIIALLCFVNSCKPNPCNILSIPETLESICDSTSKVSLTFEGISILYYFNADCSSCISNIERFKNSSMILQNNDVINIILMGFSENPSIACYYLLEMNLPFEVYKDTRQSFLALNNLNEGNFTFFINSEKKILYSSTKFDIGNIEDYLEKNINITK